MKETQESITQWANDTFGIPVTNFSVAVRAQQEMTELIEALRSNDNHGKALEEIADIHIVLARLTQRLGGDTQAQIDRKMAINRARQWKLDGSGHGQHVKDRARKPESGGL